MVGIGDFSDKVDRGYKRFSKEYFGQILDHSGMFIMNIKVLKAGKDSKTGIDYPAKLSLELHPVDKPEQITSLRLSSSMTIEDFYENLFKALGYFLTEKGIFKDPFDEKPLNPEELDIKFRDWWNHFGPKIKTAMFDGIRIFYEKQGGEY